MTKDPVCGMQVDENKAPATSTYEGKKYSFCGQECKNKFDREPQRYAHSGGQAHSGQQGQSSQSTQHGQSAQHGQSTQQQNKQDNKHQTQEEHAHR